MRRLRNRRRAQRQQRTQRAPVVIRMRIGAIRRVLAIAYHVPVGYAAVPTIALLGRVALRRHLRLVGLRRAGRRVA